MNSYSFLIAGFAYFALGGLWFTPLFGKQWDKAVGFDRPPKWRPSAVYYVGPLVGCLIAAGAISFLIEKTQAQTFIDYLLIGLVVGVGFGATVTTTNAIAPNMPRPGLYAAVVGSYHALGSVVAAAVLYVLSA